MALLTELNICLKLAFVRSPIRADTKGRLLAAAAELFAARGFHATTMRDIAVRAGVNLAASNYHYGSKRELYLEVLRAQFAAIHAELARRGIRTPPEKLARFGPAQLAAQLRARSKVMLELLIGPPPGLHGTLMQREMSDPSEALPVIVEEFITPMVREMEAIVARCAPGLAAADVERCVFSIMAQALFYRFTMPATLRMWRRTAYPAGLAAELAEHITEFSLGGLARLAAGRRTRRPARSRRKAHAG